MSFFITTKDFIKNWELKRQRGFLFFALSEGTVFGVLLFLILEIIQLIIPTSVKDDFIDRFRWYSIFLHIILSWLIYSPIMWSVNQWLFKKHSSKID